MYPAYIEVVKMQYRSGLQAHLINIKLFGLSVTGG
jgi:hypothetical protein